MSRLVCLAMLSAAVAGCRSVPPEPPETPPAKSPPTPTTPTTSAKPTQNVPVVAQPVSNSKAEPEAPADSLSLAADCLERGQEEAAAGHLARHVRQFPNQIVFRAQLADLLYRMDRLTEAKSHFEAVAAIAQDGSPAVRRELVHYHTRLMELARKREDAFNEHLHQGIGLYHVAKRLVGDGEPKDVERLMCKAAAALKEAQSCRPDDARSAYYLYRVWAHLDQPRAADNALQRALAHADSSELTPAEMRELASCRSARTVR